MSTLDTDGKLAHCDVCIQSSQLRRRAKSAVVPDDDDML